jgi:hypothetical protein
MLTLDLLSGFIEPKVDKYWKSIYDIGYLMGVMMHHDGVSGTASQHTQNDYYDKIKTALNMKTTVLSGLIEQQLSTIIVNTKFEGGLKWGLLNNTEVYNTWTFPTYNVSS